MLLAADYGVPQMRKRLFIVGMRQQQMCLCPRHPRTTRKRVEEHPTPRRRPRGRRGFYPDMSEPDAEDVANHGPTFHSEAMLAAFASLDHRARVTNEVKARPPPPEAAGLHPRAGTSNFSPLRPVHHRYDHVLSVWMCSAESFTDDFRWPDDRARLTEYRQVGNAVPPRLARAVGERLAAFQLDPRLPLRGHRSA